MIRRLVAALLAACILGVAAGCGDDDSGPGAARFDLLLDFFPNADHAGLYLARAGGHFDREGLDVRIRPPADPADPIRQIAAGRVDLAVSYEPEVLRARDKGEPVVSVAALVRVPLTSIVSLPGAGIRSPADLRGKTVGTAGIDYQDAFLDAILARAGVPDDSVERRNVGFNFSQALLTGRVDAALGAFWNYEGTQLRLRGRDPRIIRIEQAGVPTYDELVLVANERSLRDPEERERIRRFVAALASATYELRREPESAVDALLEADRQLDPELQREALEVTLPLFLPKPGRPFGHQDPAEWETFTRFMRENGLLERVTSARGAFTNGLLPEARE